MPRQHEEIEIDDNMFAGTMADEMADEMELEDSRNDLVERLAQRRLNARRALEDYRERKQLHDELDDWDYKFDDQL
jgi:uncharacterized protein HemY